jgi:ketosteroid isomerase-like protein
MTVENIAIEGRFVEEVLNGKDLDAAGIPPRRTEEGMSTATPEQVLESIVTGINSGNLDGLMTLYESEAAFATQPGSLAHAIPGVREALAGFISMKGKLDLEVTRVLEVGDLALVIGVWTFNGTGPDGEPVRLAAKNADVLRRQEDGTWRFVIDNPWGTD